MAYKFNDAKILVVDDMIPMQTLLRSVLGTFGFKNIEVADNGEEGFKKFCRFNPDIVLTDWMMEPLNGIEMVARIRKDPMSPNRFVPVILMTGFTSRLRVEYARDVGITEFLVKPFKAKELYARIEHIIEKPRQFVDTKGFFGPDRRRHSRKEYKGVNKRATDKDFDEKKLPASEVKRQNELLDNISNNINVEK